MKLVLISTLCLFMMVNLCTGLGRSINPWKHLREAERHRSWSFMGKGAIGRLLEERQRQQQPLQPASTGFDGGDDRPYMAKYGRIRLSRGSTRVARRAPSRSSGTRTFRWKKLTGEGDDEDKANGNGRFLDILVN